MASISFGRSARPAHMRRPAAPPRPTGTGEPAHVRPLTAWLWTLVIALFGGLLRMVRLGEPPAIMFDETYYVKDAWTALLTGEPRTWPTTVDFEGARQSVDAAFAAGDTGTWLASAEYVVHPPVGKWLIAAGLSAFGGAGNPFAWRAAGAIAGTLAIVLMMRVTLRLFHDLPVAVLAGMLMSVDGVGIVLSRTGLLDIFIMVFALGAFSLMLVHRDRARRRLEDCYRADAAAPGARWTPRRRPSSHAGDEHAHLILDSRGPVIAFSWSRAGAAVLLGLATGVKWSGAYFFAAFCIISVLWDAWERHRVGYRGWLLSALGNDGPIAAAFMLPIWALTYLAGWSGWLLHPDAYMRDWAQTHPGEGLTWLPASLRSLAAYHAEMWQFHTTLDSPHPYRANPLTWPLQIRPTSFYWERITGHPGWCSLSPDSSCVTAVTSLGNPLTWWLGSACVIIAIILALCTRGDWRIWAVLAGFLGGWLPWTQYLHRTTFTFYSIVILPWIILAIAYVMHWLHGRMPRVAWRSVLGVTLALILLVSAFFYPIWTAMPVPYGFWLSHMWLKSWI